MAQATRIAIVGAGRMGQAIAARIAAADDLELAGIAGRKDALEPLLTAADVVIDFSLPEGTEQLVERLATTPVPLVCGVSGLSDQQMAAVSRLAAALPIVYDRNMSQGVTVLDAAIRKVAGALGDEFSVAIDETHHIHKKDAPSGTALKLGESVQAQRDTDIEYHSERRGEVPGDHSVIFRSPTETLTFSHSVTTRDVFADGALRAARWISGRPPGLYSMHDVLFDD